MLAELVAGRRATTIDEVVDIMTALDHSLSDNDGLKWFNRLYLQVTLSVRDAVTATTFRDPAFLATLDVVFANLYFDAIAAGDDDPARAPSAWRPVFECRRRRGIRAIQFALAGMNAHINRDLPEGIVATYRATDGAPAEGSARHEDFDKVNDLLEAVEAQIKVEFSTGLVGLVDAAGGDVDDAIAMWKVRAARAAAWTNAEVLWALRATPALRNAFFSRLDSFTGFAGRGLLLPTALPTEGKRGVYADD
jgi:Family of unknown function (DUF5995)